MKLIGIVNQRIVASNLGISVSTPSEPAISPPVDSLYGNPPALSPGSLLPREEVGTISRPALSFSKSNQAELAAQLAPLPEEDDTVPRLDTREADRVLESFDEKMLNRAIAMSLGYPDTLLDDGEFNRAIAISLGYPDTLLEDGELNRAIPTFLEPLDAMLEDEEEPPSRTTAAQLEDPQPTGQTSSKGKGRERDSPLNTYVNISSPGAIVVNDNDGDIPGLQDALDESRRIYTQRHLSRVWENNEAAAGPSFAHPESPMPFAVTGGHALYSDAVHPLHGTDYMEIDSIEGNVTEERGVAEARDIDLGEVGVGSSESVIALYPPIAGLIFLSTYY
jgi:hypothetical protein